MSGIYIHIPFCVQKCRYCDFVSFPFDGNSQEYADALRKEIRLAAKAYPHFTADTVFIGGGTPSILPADTIKGITEELYSCFCIAPKAEISIECNPGTLSREKVMAYRACGINRVSLGLQSSNDRLLAMLGRIHTRKDFENSVLLLCDCGFENINADLMYGLPTQTKQDYLSTVEFAASMGMKHISAYSLIVEDNTPIKADIEAARLLLPDEDAEFEMHSEGISLLKQLGYSRYEISNYAIKGYECRHNLNYWDCGEYIGLGLNSHSCMRIGDIWQRYCNHSDFASYYSVLEANRLPVEHTDIIGISEEITEFVMLGLRKVSGFRLNDFHSRFHVAFTDYCSVGIAKLEQDGYIVVDNDTVRLTDKGLDVQNYAVLELTDV